MVPPMPSDASSSDSAESADDSREFHRPPRVSRHIQPIGPRVLIRIIRGQDRSESGLYLPAGSKESNAEALLGEVIEVARTQPSSSSKKILIETDEDEDGASRYDLGANVSGIPVGAQVLFAKDKGLSVPWDETLRLLAVRYILAIVQTITEEQLQ
jgi:co-chaperonin GroES (HSP10)